MDAPRHRAQDPHGRSRSTGCRSAPRRTRWSATAIGDPAAADLLVAAAGLPPASRPAGTPSPTGTKELLKEAKKLLATYNEAPTPTPFLTLLDWAYLAVHNGDLDSRDNVGLRAIYDWTRDDVAFPALERWIMSGNDADCSSGWATTPRCR